MSTRADHAGFTEPHAVRRGLSGGAATWWLLATALVWLLVQPARGEHHGEWITDDLKGCVVWNPDPAPDQHITWSGPCRDGKAHGHGILQWIVNGKPAARYEGEFVAGKRQGHAIKSWAEGDRYEGDFVDDERTGHGIFMWPNGDIYEGAFLKGMRTGPGNYMSADGGAFEGNFLDNEPHGAGNCRTPDGVEARCEFDHGNFLRWLD